MSISKITDSEINERLVQSLPTKPNLPASLGGKGYTATAMKAAFDALPLLIAERFNALIEDILTSKGAELVTHIDTGIKGEYSLKELFEGIKDSTILDIITFDGEPLSLLLGRIKSYLSSSDDLALTEDDA